MKTNPQKAFLGVGWTFPPQIDVDGDVSLTEYEQDVRQAVLIILGTNPGERVMRPDFGAGLNQFVFEPVNSGTMHAVAQHVKESLIDWEPRITILAVNVTSDPVQMNRLLIDIDYQIRSTNTTANIVYPFYLMEGGTV